MYFHFLVASPIDSQKTLDRNRRSTIRSNKSEELGHIKSLTFTIEQKRELLRQAKRQKTKATANLIAKAKESRRWQNTRRNWHDFWSRFTAWRGAFKTIEGHFGTAVASYFRFVRFVFFLNLAVALLLLGVVVLPQVIMKPHSFRESVEAGLKFHNLSALSDNQWIAVNCTAEHLDFLSNIIRNESLGQKTVDFFQGTGWMAQTALFMGFYFNKTYVLLEQTQQHYNMPLAYLLATFAYFTISLIAMVRYTARGVKDSALISGEALSKLSNKLLCGWDYTLTNENAGELKHKNLTREYLSSLREQREERERRNMTTGARVCLYVKRIVINVLVLAILGACFYLIYWTNEQASSLGVNRLVQNNAFLRLLVQYLPSITITGLNIIIPIIFEKLVLAENYAPDLELKITIARTVFLRLASLAVLVVSLRAIILDCPAQSASRLGGCAQCVRCWETYVGQQFYKLVMLDFIVVCAVTFIVEFPRKLIGVTFDGKLCQKIGEQEFQIPKNVLDVVYSQTLCWLGTFYSPLIAGITVMKFFIYFYVKKLTLMKNFMPAKRPYRASRSNSFFMVILLISFVLCVFPVA